MIYLVFTCTKNLKEYFSDKVVFYHTNLVAFLISKLEFFRKKHSLVVYLNFIIFDLV